jgi:GT2 family glycosyltransferase
MSSTHTDLKAHATALARASLDAFLDTRCTLDCQPTGTPRVSAVMLVCNRAELTLGCLQTLALRLNAVPVEIILVDNGSTDATGLLLERVRGLKVVRNPVNLGYPKAVNQGARLASGEYLLMLNNDTTILGRSIDRAVEFLEANPRVGAVGGKIVLLDGTLQEAGCGIWGDGCTFQYGRGKPIDAPACAFQRDVDYCSGAFLMTRRDLFQRLGGLEEAFSPGYFEDPDYCVRLWKANRRVVYLPEVVVLHYENATASTLFALQELYDRNKALFAAKHADWIRTRPCVRELSDLFARISHDLFFKTLVFPEGMPPGDATPGLGGNRSGPFLKDLIAGLHAIDAFVTVCVRWNRDRPAVPLPPTVETVCLSEEELPAFLAARHNYYDLVLLGDAPCGDLLALLRAWRMQWAAWQEGQFVLGGVPGEGSVRAA